MKKDVSYPDVIKRIQAVTHTRSQTELASLLEISQSSVAEAKRRQAIPADWYLKLFEKLGVNPDWLKSGSGPVYLRTEAGYVPSDGDGPPIDPGLLGSPLAQSALAPVYAICGDSTKTGSPAAALQPIGKIALPKPYAREGILVLDGWRGSCRKSRRGIAEVRAYRISNFPKKRKAHNAIYSIRYGPFWKILVLSLAEGEGFEPPDASRRQRFSRPPH